MSVQYCHIFSLLGNKTDSSLSVSAEKATRRGRKATSNQFTSQHQPKSPFCAGTDIANGRGEVGTEKDI